MDIKNKLYKMMISCDKATYFSDISQYKKLSITDKLKLKTHLMACKPCNTYHEQNKIITEKIKKVSDLKGSENGMSEEVKEKLKKEIEKNI